MCVVCVRECVCAYETEIVCVCACVWERERECVWERENVCERDSVCVCVKFDIQSSFEFLESIFVHKTQLEDAKTGMKITDPNISWKKIYIFFAKILFLISILNFQSVLFSVLKGRVKSKFTPSVLTFFLFKLNSFRVEIFYLRLGHNSFKWW